MGLAGGGAGGRGFFFTCSSFFSFPFFFFLIGAYKRPSSKFTEGHKCAAAAAEEEEERICTVGGFTGFAYWETNNLAVGAIKPTCLVFFFFPFNILNSSWKKKTGCPPRCRQCGRPCCPQVHHGHCHRSCPGWCVFFFAVFFFPFSLLTFFTPKPSSKKLAGAPTTSEVSAILEERILGLDSSVCVQISYTTRKKKSVFFVLTLAPPSGQH